MPKVSVVMATYNAAGFLGQAIESILSQTFSDFELIVVDDASSDATAEILGRFSDPRLRVLKHAENKGAALSRNDAMIGARGKYVAIMDDDDISAPSRLEGQVRFLDDRPDIGLVGCGIYDNIDVDGFVLYTASLPEDNDAIQKTLVEKWCFLHPSIMFRREILERVGGYREAFEVAEDHDFILRILDHFKAHNLNEKLVSYRINPKGLSVVKQDYINELGEVAMALAKRRRQGLPENFEGETPRILALKRRGNAGASGFLKKWRDSLYASNRYYGFGCKALYVGRFKQARKCFARSIKNNCLFGKSWIGLCCSYLPFNFFKKVRFIFRSSKQYHEELDREFPR